MDDAAMDDAATIETRVLEAVRASGATVEPLPCDPSLADTAAFCAHYGVDPADSANAILVVSKSEPRRYAVCLVLATHRLDVNHAVRARLGGKKCSFASADETVAFTGQMVGGVGPFALPADLPIWIDAAVTERPNVVIGGGSRSLKLRLDPRDLLRIAGAEVVSGLAARRPEAVEPHPV